MRGCFFFFSHSHVKWTLLESVPYRADISNTVYESAALCSVGLAPPLYFFFPLHFMHLSLY